MGLVDFSLEGKVAIITGAGRGLGKSMALAMARAGADIVAVARSAAQIETTAEEVRQLGRKALAIRADVTDSRQVYAMVERTIREFGKIDIMVNNAGALSPEGSTETGGRIPLLELTDEIWQQQIDVGLNSAFYCSRAVGKYMVKQRSGKIINISSTCAFRGYPSTGAYGPAKAGVIVLTKTLAVELAKYGICVNCIAPGGHATGVRLDGNTNFIPIGRFASPDEIGPLAVFLASSGSNYMTGDVVCEEGGSLAGGYAPTGYAPVIPLR